MTEHEARALYVRIANSWPAEQRGVAAETWIEVLADLDAGTAGTALIRLRNDIARTPSIKQFRDAYYALRTPANEPVGPACEYCDSTGWLASDKPAGGRECRPCTCHAGRHADRVHKLIDDHRRLHRQGPYRPKHDDRNGAPTIGDVITDLDLFNERGDQP